MRILTLYGYNFDPDPVQDILTDKLNNLGFLHPVPIPQGNWLINTMRLDPILFFKAELTPDYIVKNATKITSITSFSIDLKSNLF